MSLLSSFFFYHTRNCQKGVSPLSIYMMMLESNSIQKRLRPEVDYQYYKHL
ncbi:hypothetical protein CLOSCI_00822 [[Clostridium] scindens ATCC 35704]|nr:hypothetical protein CLOSCI_00822 [[Clostridium] scindens ATCC 35704]